LRLEHVPTCKSTQELAAADQSKEWMIFWADHQEAGRGRQQRPWHDQPGLDLAATFSIHTDLPDPIALPVVLPLCVRDAVAPLLGNRASELRIKWPNDLLLGGKKLAGVLIDADQRRPVRYRIGVGINVNGTLPPVEVASIAVSLRMATGAPHDRLALLEALARSIDRTVTALQQGRTAEFETRYAEGLGLTGQRVFVRGAEAKTGILEAISLTGLRLQDGSTFPLAQVTELRAE
jgi:BirA family biotin operon repressor/biotin-[acetyl-CoA-carboxylase] ligase